MITTKVVKLVVMVNPEPCGRFSLPLHLKGYGHRRPFAGVSQARSWSRWPFCVRNCCQKLTNLLETTFEIPPRRAWRGVRIARISGSDVSTRGSNGWSRRAASSTTTTSQKYAAVPRRARISNPQDYKSLNSRRESSIAEEKKGYPWSSSPRGA